VPYASQQLRLLAFCINEQEKLSPLQLQFAQEEFVVFLQDANNMFCYASSVPVPQE
jgi:hypothetical protein